MISRLIFTCRRRKGRRVPGLSYPKDIVEIVRRATAIVIRPIFFAMLIILLAFIPVFALHGEAGKLFHPLAFTKSYAMAGAMLLALTVVPVLASLLVRGKLRDEGENPILRFLLRLYRPVLEWSLDHGKAVVVAAVVILLAALALGRGIGWDFMPPLNERALLYMPTTLPSASVPEINRIMSAQDKILASFPEVESVVGKLGRADTATDPAPVSMIETTIRLKPESEWREGFNIDDLIAELDAAGFLHNPPKRPGMIRNLRHWFERGEVTEQELRTLHGVVTELSRGRMVHGRFAGEVPPLPWEDKT
jgi:Cu(I)/Ag(I) efflux system membrane protein CusA/SilA